MPWITVAVVLMAHLALFGALYAYKGRFVFSEGLYFQALLQRMSLGEVPYLDFSYYYGPAMLYPAHWLSSLFPLEAAYALWYVATYLAGLFILAVVLTAFLPSKRMVAMWFVLLALGLFNPLTGLNFTFTRYLLPTLALLSAADAIRMGGRRLYVAVAILGVAMLYSFEVAVLTVAGLLLLACFHLARRHVARLATAAGVLLMEPASTEGLAEPRTVLEHGRREAARAALILAGGAAGATVAFLALDRSGGMLVGSTDSFVAFLSGAHNQPIYPNLLFFTLAGLSIIAVGASIRLVTAPGGGHALPAIAAYVGLAVLSQRASFSATDYNHIIFFGLPVLLLSLRAADLWGGARAKWGLAAAITLGFVLPMQSYQLGQLAPGLFSRSVAAQPAADRPASSSSVEASLMTIVDRLGTERPYVMWGLFYYSVPVYQRYGLRYPGHDTEPNSARTPELMEAMIDDVRRSDAYVVMRRADYEDIAAPARTSSVWNWYSAIVGAPLPGTDVQFLNLESAGRLRAQFVEFVRREFKVTLEVDDILVFARR